MISINTSAKPSLLYNVLQPACVSFFDSFKFSLCCKKCCFFFFLFFLIIFHQSKSVYCLITMAVIVPDGSLLSLSSTSFIFVPVFSSVRLLFFFFIVLVLSVIRNSVMWYCFSVYREILVQVHSFLLLGLVNMLLCAVIILIHQ